MFSSERAIKDFTIVIYRISIDNEIKGIQIDTREITERKRENMKVKKIQRNNVPMGIVQTRAPPKSSNLKYLFLDRSCKMAMGQCLSTKRTL